VNTTHSLCRTNNLCACQNLANSRKRPTAAMEERQLRSYAEEDGSALEVPRGEVGSSQENRYVLDPNRGMMLDMLTMLHYNQAENLFYNFGSKPEDKEEEDRDGEEGSKKLHWNKIEGRYMTVIEEEWGNKRTDTDQGEEVRQDEGKVKVLSESFDETASWQYDTTSAKYFHKETGLYYDPASDLYWDYDTFPALCYHYIPNERRLLVVKQEEDETNEKKDEGDEDESVPDTLYLVIEKILAEAGENTNEETGDNEEGTKGNKKEQTVVGQQVYIIGKSANAEDTERYSPPFFPHPPPSILNS